MQTKAFFIKKLFKAIAFFMYQYWVNMNNPNLEGIQKNIKKILKIFFQAKIFRNIQYNATMAMNTCTLMADKNK